MNLTRSRFVDRYDHTDLRVRKTVRDLNGIDSSVYDYTYNGKMLTHLTCGNDNLHFFYDAHARPAMLSWNGTKYHYLYDLQSDVIGLVDTSGSVVVEYKYDAWGRIIGSTGSLATTLGRLNPFRYRGYVYDEETQMYYYRSRYYCPEIHRWISIDEDLAGGHKLLGRNLVVYSANNPTNCTDITGERTYFINGIFAGFDLLASISFWDAENCFSGFHDHTGYFSEDNLLNTVNLVGSCSRSNKRKKGAGACR